MNIGTLNFEILGKTDGINKALAETENSIKNFSDKAKSGSAEMGDAMQAAAAKIEQAWSMLSVATYKQEFLIEGCEKAYREYGEQAAKAAAKGTTESIKESDALFTKQKALGNIIEKLKEQGKVLQEQHEILTRAEDGYNGLVEKVQKSTSRLESFRSQLRNLREEMAAQEVQAEQTGGKMAVYALRATDEYKKLQIEAGKLSDAIDDANQQMQYFSNDNSGLQGVISAVSGVAGAMSAAQGAAGLLADENEDLQKIMVKVQSVMAVTMGLQQMANALNKDSAASLTFLNKIREAYAETYTKVSERITETIKIAKEEIQAGKEAIETSEEINDALNENADIIANATNAQEKATEAVQQNISAKANEKATEELNTAAKGANTIATEGQKAAEEASTESTKKNIIAEGAETKQINNNTAAKGFSAVATRVLTKATAGLAGAIKAVGAALKSILPLAVIAGVIAGIAAAFNALTKKSREAKKEQEEYYKAVSEGAAEPVAKIESLAAKWGSLGNDMKAKQKFVEENKAKFEELGISVKSVEDAEKALVKFKDKFIAAQLAKAKALAATNKAAELQKEVLELQLEKEDYQSRGKKRKANRRQKEIDELEAQAEELYERAAEAQAAGDKAIEEAGLEAANGYKEGMVGHYEQLIAAKKAALKELTNPKDYAAAEKEIEKLQKTLDGITGANRRRTGGGTAKDPFKEKLDKQKAQYQQYAKWRNSTDEILQQTAATQFKQLLQQGGTYLEYLKNQREKLMSEMLGKGTKKQRDQLATINNAIAEETKETIIENFNNQLEEQLNGANSLLDKLSIIEKKREKLQKEDVEIFDEDDKKKAEQLSEEMMRDFNGNVDLLHRKIIDAIELAKKGWMSEKEAAGQIATLYSSQYGIKDQKGDIHEILVTPILPDGTVLSQNELEDYIYNSLEGAEDILKADTKGLVIKVGVEGADLGGQRLHELHEEYYNIVQFWKKYNKIQNDEKSKSLDNQRKQLYKEIENQYRAAQQEYYDYLESRLTAFEQYQQKMAELQEKYDKETDPSQKDLIKKQMNILRQQQNTRDAQAADELVKQYRTAEEKMTAITKEHEEKKRALKDRSHQLEEEMTNALAAGDEARIEQIKKEQEAIERALKGIEKDLSKSLTEFLGEEIVGKMLDDAGTLTVKKIDEIIAAVEKKKAELPVDVDPKKFEELLEKLKKLKKETREQQTTIKSIISELQNGNIGEALKQTMVIAEKYGSTVVKTYSEVVNLLKQMGAAGDEISQQILSDIGEVAGSAAQLAVDIATQNWGNAVVSGVKLIAGAVKLWNDANRENADAIKESEEKINELENSLKNLRNTLKRTYDSGRYDLQKGIIDKLRDEIAEERNKLEAIRKDIDGSSSDYTEDDYNAQLQHIEDLEEQLNQALDDLAEDITQITIPEIGQQISDALVNAFANGLRGAKLDKEINKVVNRILKNAALNFIKADYLMPQIEEWYEEFKAAMKDGLTEDEADALRASMLEKTQEFKDAMQAWQEMWGDDELDSNTLSGAIKGASQESIDLLAGYTNATRIIEQSQLDVLRSQLARIASIDARAAQAVELLNSIYRNMGMTTTITAPQVNIEDAKNRAYGITNDYEL